MTQDKNLIYGKNPVKEKINMAKTGILYIRKGTNENQISEIIRIAKTKAFDIQYLENDKFDKSFSNFNHQGVVFESFEKEQVIIDEKEFFSLLKSNDKKSTIVLILDGIKDVGNLGAVLRSALLFNAYFVILPKDNSAPINEVVIKRSAGAVFKLNVIYVTNISRTIDELKKMVFGFMPQIWTAKLLVKLTFLISWRLLSEKRGVA